MVYLDLAELDAVLKLSPFWSVGRFAVARFRRSDYFSLADTTGAADADSAPLPDTQMPTRSPKLAPKLSTKLSIDECVRTAVAQRLGFRPSGAIRVLTNFRYFGYLINPISCYYCFDDSHELVALLIEVTNTPWGQRTHYVLDLRRYQAGDFVDFPKDMHVSPFMPMNMIYRWKGAPPGEKLRYTLASFIAPAHDHQADLKLHRQAGPNIRADAEHAPVRQFDSGVNFERIEINASSLNRIIWQFPWMTGKVALAIYWQALKLWLKRIPFVPHPGKISGSGC